MAQPKPLERFGFFELEAFEGLGLRHGNLLPGV